ncbi:leucine-rich repeat domain-containing protein [Spirosoma migulaei]
MNSRTPLLVVIILLNVLLISCNKSNDPDPNLPPAAFTISGKLAPNGPHLVLTWTKAKDPNGDPVTYTVFWKDTLTRTLTDTTYTLRNVHYNTTVVGSVIAKDSKKASTLSSFSIAVGAEPYLTIPDVNFEQALFDLKIDSLMDGRLRAADAFKVISLNVSNKKISRLQGIEGFISLKTLDCSGNSLTSLDISQATALTKLYCGSNKLTSLNVAKNLVLNELDCSENNLTGLDVSLNTSLTLLGSTKNSLTSLDLSKNAKLTKLYCTNNRLTSLDISKNTALTVLWCFSNTLTNLDLRANPLLQVLQCFGNKIQTICVADLTKVATDWQKDTSATYQVCK